MGKAIATVPNAALVDWDNQEMQAQIKETYGKNLAPPEWALFMGLGKATGLNPFLREIWAVKYGNNPASVFVGRDGYRRSAQAHADYEYHYAMAVYANDEFSLEEGQPKHTFKPADRGALVGAYCVVKRKSSARAVTTWVQLVEYKQNGGVWVAKPATMIVKVAEAQGLRASFQELFAGTYEESEDWEVKKAEVVSDGSMPPPAPGQTFIGDDGKPEVVGGAQAPKAGTFADEVAQGAKAAPVKRGRPAKKPTEVIDAQVTAAPAPSDVPDFQTPPAPKYAEGSKLGKLFNKNEEAPAATPKVPEDDIPPEPIRPDQMRKMHAVWNDYRKVVPMDDEKSKEVRRALVKDMFRVESSTALNALEADELIGRIEAMTELAREHVAGEANSQASGDAF